MYFVKRIFAIYLHSLLITCHILATMRSGFVPFIFSTFPLTPEVFYPHQTGSYTALPCVNVPDKAVRIFTEFRTVLRKLLCTAISGGAQSIQWTVLRSVCLIKGKCRLFFPAETPVDIRRTPIRICGYEILQPENPDKTPHSGCFAEIIRYHRIYISFADPFSFIEQCAQNRMQARCFPQSISTMAQSLTTISTFTP